MTSKQLWFYLNLFCAFYLIFALTYVYWFLPYEKWTLARETWWWVLNFVGLICSFINLKWSSRKS